MNKRQNVGFISNRSKIKFPWQRGGKKKKDTERIPEWRVLEATARAAKWKRTFLMNFEQLGWIAFETHWNIFKYRHCHEVFWTFRKPLCQWCPTSMGQWEQSGKQHNTVSLCPLQKFLWLSCDYEQHWPKGHEIVTFGFTTKLAFLFMCEATVISKQFSPLQQWFTENRWVEDYKYVCWNESVSPAHFKIKACCFIKE